MNKPSNNNDPSQQRIRLPRAVVDAMAGAVAGAAARMVVSPLDVIKIRFQVQLEPIHAVDIKSNPLNPFKPVPLSRLHPSKYTGLMQAAKDIWKEEGVVGYWRGTVPGLLLVMPYCSIQFVVLHKFKSLVTASTDGNGNNRRMNPALSFVGGAVAGVAATVGSYPFDLLRTVLASQGEPKIYPSMMSACRGIVQQKGIAGLFAGLGPTLVEIVPYAGLQFGLYDACKRATRRWNEAEYRKNGTPSIASSPSSSSHSSSPPRNPSLSLAHVSLPSPPPSQAIELSVLQQLMCGLVAGTLAKVTCHPLDVVKKRFQVEGLARHPRYGARIQEHAYSGMYDALRRIAHSEGTQGLYKGLLPSVLKAAPSAAVTFLVYDLLSKHWVKQFCEEETGEGGGVRLH